MNKSIVGVLIALVAIGGIVAVIATSNKEEVPSHSQSDSTTQTNESTTSEGQANPQASNEAEETKSTNEVTIQNFAYAPTNIKVKAGTTVTWTNQDSTGHDVTPDNETDEFKRSDLLGQGESYSVTFKTPGTYSYFCTPHPYMKASVEVVE